MQLRPFISAAEELAIACQSANPDWAKLSRKILQQSDRLSPTQISIILNSLAKNPSDAQRQLVHALTKSAEAQANDFKPFQIGLIVNACSKLGFNNTRLLKAFADKATIYFNSSHPINHQTVALTFSGLYKLNLADKKFQVSVVSRMKKIVATNPSSLSPHDAAAILHAFAQTPTLAPGAYSLIPKLFETAAESSSVEHCIVGLLGLAHLKRPPEISDERLEQAIGRVETDIGRLSFVQLANAAFAVATVASGKRSLTFLEKVSNASKPLLESPGIKNSSLILMISGFGKSSDSRFGPLLFELARRLHGESLRPDGAATVLNALSKHNVDYLDYFDLERSIAELNGATSGSSIDSETNEKLGQTASLILVGLVRADRLDAALHFLESTVSEPLIRGMSDQSLVNCAHALATLKILHVEAQRNFQVIDRQLVRMIDRLTGSTRLPTEALNQLGTVAIVCSLTNLVDELRMDSLRWLKDCAISAYRSMPQPPPSSLHRQVAESIGEFGMEGHVDIRKDRLHHEVRVGPFFVDIVLDAVGSP